MEYTLTIWLAGRGEKTWMELSEEEIARFEKEYMACLQSDSRAVYVVQIDDKKRTIRLDLITDFSIIENS